MIEEQREPGEKRLVTSSGARPKPRSATQANSKQSASKAAQVAKANELAAKSVAAGAPARQLAAEVLQRIDTEGAYANLLLPAMLERSHLETRDRGFVTELVYGTTRMRRSCDWLIDRFVINELDAQARAFLRIGAYQLVFLNTPPHAAVSSTVDAAPRKLHGLVNAVLRRVADAPRDWPDEATRLSYPDWIIERLTGDIGVDDARAALETMNTAATVTERDDGYTQDLASQWVADAVEAQAGERVLDVCAAPGGKATRMAQSGATVIAADVRPARVGLIAANARRINPVGTVNAIAADGTAPPYGPASFDRILVDAPCSGLGALRRRPDARWRIQPEDVETLVGLQQRLIDAAIPLLKPGGSFVYSVCTLTNAESVGIDDYLAQTHPELVAVDPPEGPWRAAGRGARLLPQDADTDGMYMLRLRRTAPS